MTLKFYDGRILVGTQLQILRQMRQLDFDTEGDIRDYIQRLVQRATVLGYTINPQGDTDIELAERTVAELLRVGLLDRVRA